MAAFCARRPPGTASSVTTEDLPTRTMLLPENALRRARRAAARWGLILAVAASLATSACGASGPSASPAGATADDFVTTYEQYLAASEWAAAWGMVSEEQQKAWVSLESFTANEQAFIRLYGPAVVVHSPVTHPDEVATAVTDAGFTTPDLARAALVTVDRVPVRDNSGWEMFLVSSQGGEPRIWQIR